MKNSSRKPPILAGSVLSAALDRLGLKPALSRHNIVNLWPRIVDPAVARHVKADKVVGSTLHLVVDSSVWMNEMAAIKHVLLEKVNAMIGAGAPPITDIRFSQRSRVREDNAPTEREAPEAELTEEDRQLVRVILERIKDDELRAVLKRILEKDLRLKHRRGETVSGLSRPQPD